MGSYPSIPWLVFPTKTTSIARHSGPPSDGNQSTTKDPQETPKAESTIAPLTANKNVFTQCTIMATRITNATFHYFNPRKCLIKKQKKSLAGYAAITNEQNFYCRCMFRPGNPTAFYRHGGLVVKASAS